MEWYVDVGHGKLCSGGLGRSVTARFVVFRYVLAGRGKAVLVGFGRARCVSARYGLFRLGGLGEVCRCELRMARLGAAKRGKSWRSWQDVS